MRKTPKNACFYYNDKLNSAYVVQIRDKYFTNRMIKKSFNYRDNYFYTEEEARQLAANLASYLKTYRELRIGPLNPKH